MQAVRLASLERESFRSNDRTDAAREIVDALDRRQADAAVEAMSAHLENVELNLRLDPRSPDLRAALLGIR